MNFRFYVINLKRSSERKLSVIKQFKKFNIKNYEFVTGLDAQKFSKNQLSRFIDKNNIVRPLSPGEIGCCLGHIKALRSFIANPELDFCFIMEDDFLMKVNPEEILHSIDNEILNEGPVLLYAYVNDQVIFKKVKDISPKTKLYKVKDPFIVWSAMGYLINKATAEKHLMSLYPIKNVADSWSFSKQKGGIRELFVLYPFLMEHEIFDSSRTKSKNSILDWIIRKQLPGFYQMIKLRRKKFLLTDIGKINFIE